MGRRGWTPRLWNPKDGRKPTSQEISRIAKYMGVTSQRYADALHWYFHY